MKKANKKIAVVTGGAGFIGSHMVDLLLEKDYHVRVIDNLSGGHEKNLAHLKNSPNLTCEWKSICDLAPQAKIFKDVQFVFHFAGIGDIVPSIENPTSYMDTNIQGTVHILECSRNYGVQKVVYAASSSCYGLAKTPTDEKHQISPQYPYALSKYLGECCIFHWHQVYKLPVNSIRIFNAYGTRVRTTGVYGAVFGVFLKQKLTGSPLTIVGDGTQSRDFVYVSDIAQAFYLAAQTKLTGEVWNVGADKPQTINYLAELIGGERVYIPKRPGEPDCTWADITKIKSQLGWEPTVSFKEGVRKMLSEIKIWKDAPLWTPQSIEKATKTWFTHLGES